jgi:hypothetical protein
VVDGTFKLPDALFAGILRFAFPGGGSSVQPAPECRQQPPVRVQGETTLYPRIKPR